MDSVWFVLHWYRYRAVYFWIVTSSPSPIIVTTHSCWTHTNCYRCCFLANVCALTLFMRCECYTALLCQFHVCNIMQYGHRPFSQRNLPSNHQETLVRLLWWQEMAMTSLLCTVEACVVPLLSMGFLNREGHYLFVVCGEKYRGHQSRDDDGVHRSGEEYFSLEHKSSSFPEIL